MDRRELLRAGLMAAMGGMACQTWADETNSHTSRSAPDAKSLQQRICLFTDLIDDSDYTYDEVASMLQQLKIAGADLTVRPGGLVRPEVVKEELPKVAAVFRDRGLSIPMVSTQIVSASDPVAKDILHTLQQLDIGYYKLGYFPYGE